MKYKKLGTTDLAVSLICLGSMNWGEQNTEKDAHDQLDYAISQGINFIDTAETYPVPPNAISQGRTETYIGNWLTKRKKGMTSLLLLRLQVGQIQMDTFVKIPLLDLIKKI